MFQSSRLPIYGGFFILGIAAKAAHWQAQFCPLPRLVLLLLVPCILCMVLVAAKVPGLLDYEVGRVLESFFYPLVAVSLFLVALHVIRVVDRINLRFWISRASFGIYLVHLPIVVALQFFFMGMSFSPWLKAALVAGIAGTMSYILACFLVCLQVTRTIV